MSSDSVFGEDVGKGGLRLPNRFRPISILSVSVHSPMKDDDTMI